MENWRSQAEDSASTSDIFPYSLSNLPSSLSNLPQLYSQFSPIQDHFSSHTLQIPQISHHPIPLRKYVVQQETQIPLVTPHKMTLEETMATIAAGQSLLVESMTRLLSRLENSSPRQQVVNDLAAGISNINLDRAAPPHQSYLPQNHVNGSAGRSQMERPSYAPVH